MKTKVLFFAVITAAVSSFQSFGEEDKKADVYPLTTCVVSGETLGEMGDVFIYDYEGREVRFCCKMCKKDFLKDPKKYLAMLDKAEADAESRKKTEGDSDKESKDSHAGHDHGDQ